MRNNKLIKTKFQSVYETTSKNGNKNYIVKFKHLNKRYPDKNFTHLFGCTTAKQTSDKLQEIKVSLSKGTNPFEKEIQTTVDDYFEIFIEGINGKDKYIKTTYYNKHIQPIIGKMNADKVEEKHILAILNSVTLKDKSSRTKYTTKWILTPIFKKSIKNGKRTSSPLEDIKFTKNTEKKPLSSRLVDNEINIVKTLYNEILSIEDSEMKAILLFSLMLARRRGEILLLEWGKIYVDKVYADKSTTKTNINDEYPLPTEILNLLNELKVNKDDTKQIFSFKVDRPTRVFKRLLEKSSIKLVKGETLTLHDTRHLFMSIMTMETKNADLVDKCISHSKRESIRDTYLSFNYENRKKVFEDYWNILRD